MSIYEKAQEIKEQMVKDRRWLHQNPEVGLDTFKTADYVENRLKEMGYTPFRVGDTGVIADLVKDENATTLLLRADMDALPIKENTGLDFASDDGNMHACGHDMHTAALLGAAQLLKNMEGELKGNVKFVFQPDEENLRGAKKLLDNGLLTKGLKPDYGFATHINGQIPTGYVAAKVDTLMASSDIFDIIVHGSGGHGSMPEQCVDSINIAVHIHLALQELMSREIGISDRVILTIGAFQGGDAANIIPETTTIKGTLRTLDEEIRGKLLKRMEEMVPAVAEVYKGKAEFKVVNCTPTTYNNPEIYDEVVDIIKGIDPEKIKFMTMPGDGAAGSEDYAYISQEVPSTFVIYGAKNPDIAEGYPQHHEKVTFDEEALVNAATLFTEVATKFLENHSK